MLALAATSRHRNEINARAHPYIHMNTRVCEKKEKRKVPGKRSGESNEQARGGDRRRKTHTHTHGIKRKLHGPELKWIKVEPRDINNNETANKSAAQDC